MRLDRIHLKRGNRYLLLSFMIMMGLISVLVIGGCNDDGSGTGTLAITMGDSVTEKISQAWVTIEEVSVHESGDSSEGEDLTSWKTIEGVGIPDTYNLAALRDGLFEELGEVTLKAGHYTQIRLKLGGDELDNYVVPINGPDQKIPLQISSQDETGIKLIKGFDIESGAVTELHLDWDLENSIIEMSDGEYRLQPTIKILNVDAASTLSGIVTGGDPDAETIPLPDAVVTATKINDSSDVTTTPTGEFGGYMLVLEEGTYNIIVSKEGYDDASREVQIDYEVTDYTGEDFTLTPTTISEP